LNFFFCLGFVYRFASPLRSIGARLSHVKKDFRIFPRLSGPSVGQREKKLLREGQRRSDKMQMRAAMSPSFDWALREQKSKFDS
jgi:hypothetical protein